MVDFTKIVEEYSIGEIELITEKGFIDAVIKIEEWNKLTDIEKVEKRIKELNKKKYFAKDFIDNSAFNLKMKCDESVVELSKSILNFINFYENNPTNDNTISRIYVLFCCEIKLLNRDLTFNSKSQIPVEVISKLIENVPNKEEKYLTEIKKVISVYEIFEISCCECNS